MVSRFAPRRRPVEHRADLALPANIEAEQGVLACCLVFEEAQAKAFDQLKVTDFYRGAHAAIFAAMVELFGKETIGLPTVMDQLRRKGITLDEAGGLGYVVDLASSIPTGRMVDYAIRQVLDASIRRQAIAAAYDVIADAQNPESKDIEANALGRFITLSGARTAETLAIAGEVAKGHLEEMQRRSELGDHPDAKHGLVEWGFHDLDYLLTMGPGDLIYLAARPAMGKTALALNLARRVAEAGTTALVFSLEMSKRQLVQRLVSMDTGIEPRRQQRGAIRPEEWSAVLASTAAIDALPLWLEDRSALTTGQAYATAQRVSAIAGRPGLIVIDYLQLMTPDNPRLGLVQQMGQLSAGVKQLARDIGCPVVCLSQLSRAVESRPDKRPILSDLRDSGNLEQDADAVLFVYRDEYYNPVSEAKTDEEREAREKLAGITEVIIGKQRQGPVGMAKLEFDKQRSLFRDHIPEDPLYAVRP